MKNDGIRKTNNIFRVLRLCLGLNLNEMAKLCGLSAVYLNELELGKKTNPSDFTLQKIADACELRLDTLRYFTEAKTGDDLDYQSHLLRSLEYYAQSMQNATLEDSPEETMTSEPIIEQSATMSVYSTIKNDLEQTYSFV